MVDRKNNRTTMGFEEDTYTTIFKAMQHPIRRRILRMISEKPSTYTEIQRDLNIDNGLLNYHLEALSSLINKNEEEKYTLSDFGKATASLIRGVEEPSKVTVIASTPLIMKGIAVILAVALIISGVGLIEFNNRYLDLSDKYNTLTIEKNDLQSALIASEASRAMGLATLQTAVIKSLINNAPQALSYLLTNGSLIISRENIENTIIPELIEKVNIRILSPIQIQELADSINYFYYLKFNRIEIPSQNSATVNVVSIPAKSLLSYYPTNWDEVNVTMVMKNSLGEWHMDSAMIDLIAWRSGIGSRITLAIASARTQDP